MVRPNWDSDGVFSFVCVCVCIYHSKRHSIGCKGIKKLFVMHMYLISLA